MGNQLRAQVSSLARARLQWTVRCVGSHRIVKQRERAVMIQTSRKTPWMAIASVGAFSLPLTAARAVEVTSSSGWSASFDGNISAHVISANASTLGGEPSDVTDTRIT